MTFTAYLQNEHPAIMPDISWFDLHRVYSTCPAKWKHEEREIKNQQAMAEHAAILNPVAFKEQFAREPSKDDYESIMSSDADIQSWLKERGVKGYSGKKYEDLIKMVEQTGEKPLILKQEIERFNQSIGKKTAVPASQYDRVFQMRAVIFGNPQFAIYLNNSFNNVMLAGEILGVDIRISYDAITDDGVIIDYVGAASSNPEDFKNQAERGGYFLKQALLFDAFVEAYGRAPAEQFILCQERTSPLIPTMFRITDQHRMIGRIQYKSALQLLKACQENDAWPTYGIGGGIVDLPISTWVKKQYGIED